jgi:hypothetical protein
VSFTTEAAVTAKGNVSTTIAMIKSSVLKLMDLVFMFSSDYQDWDTAPATFGSTRFTAHHLDRITGRR